MTIDGRTARRERTRGQMLRAARELIERRGVADVSLDDVAASAAVTRQTVYDHFGSRAGLLVALAARADEEIDLQQRVAPMFSAPTGIDALAHLLAVVAEVTPGLLALALAIERSRTGDPAAGAAWDDRMAGRMEACRYVAGRLAHEGTLRPGIAVQEAADVVYAQIAWQSWSILVEELGWTSQQWIDRTLRFIRRSLTTGTG